MVTIKGNEQMVSSTRTDSHERSPSSREREAEPDQQETPETTQAQEPAPSEEELRVWRAQRAWDRRPPQAGHHPKDVAEALVRFVDAHGFLAIDAAYLELKRSRGYSY